MTLVGILCKGTSAEIVTDTAGYSTELERVRPVTKQVPLHHLDAVAVAAGDAAFSHFSKINCELASVDADSYDDLVSSAPDWLADALERSGVDPSDPTRVSGTFFLVGYSRRSSEYQAFACRTDDLTPLRLTGLHLQPTPMSRRPDQRQHDRFIAMMRGLGADEDDVETVSQAWMTAPELNTPATPQDWIDLALLAREERSLGGPLMRTIVAGSLTHTLLKPGLIRSKKIYDFNDHGAELTEMLTGSHHPIGQLSPCGYCDSGMPGLDCHLQVDLEEACGCGRAKSFGDCCAVLDRELVTQRLWTEPLRWGQVTG